MGRIIIVIKKKKKKKKRCVWLGLSIIKKFIHHELGFFFFRKSVCTKIQHDPPLSSGNIEDKRI